jgi:hypothetical protein
LGDAAWATPHPAWPCPQRPPNGGYHKNLRFTLPAPPPGGADPWTWADEASVRALLAPLGLNIDLRRTDIRVTARSASDLVEFMAAYHGPTMVARQLVGDRWPTLRDELVELYRDDAVPSAGEGFTARQEYLLVTARVPEP